MRCFLKSLQRRLTGRPNDVACSKQRQPKPVREASTDWNVTILSYDQFR